MKAFFVLKNNPLSNNLEDAIHARLTPLFRDALAERVFSGASVLVAGVAGALFEAAYGALSFSPQAAPVTPGTWFDLASLTKPIVTASLTMVAVSQGWLQLDAPLEQLLAHRSVPPDKGAITLRQILNHCSGLPAYQPYYQQLNDIAAADRRETLLTWILQEPLIAPPQTICAYSDLGFMLLTEVIEHTLAMPLDFAAHRFLFEPAGIEELRFLPVACNAAPEPSAVAWWTASRLPAPIYSGESRDEAAFPVTGGPPPPSLPSTPEVERNHDSAVLPQTALNDETDGVARLQFAQTEWCPWRLRLLDGEVHDENTFALGGVAGHAGLFGTARAVHRWLAELWAVHDGLANSPWIDASVIRAFWQRQNLVASSTWALGFDTPSATASSTGECLSTHSVGHFGFTGTSFWLDLDQKVLIILLTNRIHPSRHNQAIKAFRPQFHNIIMDTLYAQ
jgi:serine-type D-Ala-D-Ala carboxypeptidase